MSAPLRKLGRYDIVRILGKGAMGVVYEGRDPNLDRRVAIKTVKVENLSTAAATEYESRFRTEARSAARLQHPNIVSVYDSDRDGDVAFLVMEFIEGEDLKHHLDRGVRYSLAQALRMVGDLLSALDYAHRQKIIHRDIKPANLLIEADGRIKLTDFGVARIQDSNDVTRTQGGMVGTLKYMSPEQVQGQPVDARSDLFSVGIVLYQLLTDHRPFDGENDFSIIHQIIGQAPPAPSSFHPALPFAMDAVVARALAKDKNARFATAAEFAQALQDAVQRASDSTVVPPANPARVVTAATEASVSNLPGTAGQGSRSGTVSRTATASADSTMTAVSQELELVYWKDVKDTSDAEDLEDYLAQFPQGVYSDLARRRLKRLRTAGADGSTGTYSQTLKLPPGSQDLEATRLRGDASDSVARAIVTAAAVPPAEPAPVATAAPATDSAAASTAPLPAPASGSAASTGRAGSKLWLGAGAAVVVAGAAAFFLLGQGGAGKVGGNLPAPAASAPAPVPAPAVALAASAPASAASAGAPAAAAVPAASAAASAARAASSPAPVASAPKTGASAARNAARPATKPTTSASGSATAPNPAPARTDSGPAHTPEQRPAAPAAPAPAPASAGNPRDACENRILLGFQSCMNDQCAKPVFQNHPVCVERRELEERRRGRAEPNR